MHIEGNLTKAAAPRSRYDLLRLGVRYLPRFLHGAVRAKMSRGVFGKRPYMRGRVCLDIRGKAVFGNKLYLNGRPNGIKITVKKGGKLTVGNNFYMNFGTSIEAYCDVQIGNHVLLAPNASIIDHNQHATEPGAGISKGPVVIEDNVWLGRNVVVTPGVSIGHGSVIGANSVVSKDIPPNSLAVGAPARVIRQLEIPRDWVRD